METEEKTGLVEFGADGSVKVVSSEIDNNSHQVYMTPNSDGQFSMFMVPRSGDKSQAFVVKPTATDKWNMGILPPPYPGANNTSARSLSNTKNPTTTMNHSVVRSLGNARRLGNASLSNVINATHVPQLVVNNNAVSLAPGQPVNNSTVPALCTVNSNISTVLKSGNLSTSRTVNTSGVVSRAPPAAIAPQQPVLRPTLPGAQTQFALVPIYFNSPGVPNGANTYQKKIRAPSQMNIPTVHTVATPTSQHQTTVVTTASHSQAPSYPVNTKPSQFMNGSVLQACLNAPLVSQFMKGSVLQAGLNAPLVNSSFPIASQPQKVSTSVHSTTNSNPNANSRTAKVVTVGVMPSEIATSGQTQVVATTVAATKCTPSVSVPSTTGTNLPFPMFLFSHESAFKLKPSGTSVTSNTSQTTTSSVAMSNGNNRQALPGSTTMIATGITYPVSQYNNLANNPKPSNAQTVSVTHPGLLTGTTTTVGLITSTPANSTGMMKPIANINQSAVNVQTRNTSGSEIPNICYVFQGTDDTSKRVLLTTNKPLLSTISSPISTTPIPSVAIPNTLAYEKFKTAQNLASQALQKSINYSKTTEYGNSNKIPNSSQNVQAPLQKGPNTPKRDISNDSIKKVQFIASGVLRGDTTIAADKVSAVTPVVPTPTHNGYLDNDEPIRIESVFSLSDDAMDLQNKADSEKLVQCVSPVSKDDLQTTPCAPKDAQFCSNKEISNNDITCNNLEPCMTVLTPAKVYAKDNNFARHNLKQCTVVLPRFKADSKRKVYSAQTVLRDMRKEKTKCTKKCKKRLLRNIFCPPLESSERITRSIRSSTVRHRIEKNTVPTKSSSRDYDLKVGELHVPTTSESRQSNMPNLNTIEHHTIVSSGCMTSISASVSSNKINTNHHGHIVKQAAPAYKQQTTETSELNKSIQTIPFIIQKNSPPTPIILQRRIPPADPSPLRLTSQSSLTASNKLTVKQVRSVDQPTSVAVASQSTQILSTNVVSVQTKSNILNSASSSSDWKATKKFYLMKSGGNTILIPYPGNASMLRGFITDNSNAAHLMKSASTSSSCVIPVQTVPAVASSTRNILYTTTKRCTTVSNPTLSTSVPIQQVTTNVKTMADSIAVTPLPVPSVGIKAEPKTVGYGDEHRRTPSPPVLVKEEPINRGYSDELLVHSGSKRTQSQSSTDINPKKCKQSCSDSQIKNYQAELTATTNISTPPVLPAMSVSSSIVPPLSSTPPAAGSDEVGDYIPDSGAFTSSITTHVDRIRKLKEKLKRQMQAVEDVRRKCFDDTTSD